MKKLDTVKDILRICLFISVMHILVLLALVIKSSGLIWGAVYLFGALIWLSIQGIAYQKLDSYLND